MATFGGGGVADCSLRFCSLSCPQWCYSGLYFPPPPLFPDDSSSASLSPLIIALIGILASAVLLVAYYVVVSYFRRRRRRRSPYFRHQWQEHHQDQHHHQHQQAAPPPPPSSTAEGLEEWAIRSIAVCRYKKGDGLVVTTECPVCLAEFRDGESLRLLPTASMLSTFPALIHG
ncbi:unnamed protein product [Spirodela intermedia]|uniref:RING-type E3 ubiquitin transferase n=1 Tax=Spirodela intermedia TaxID=51605 RepID=A0A7I8IHM6_SPIIN|nr:unnamed protein product [Spirodela intermedia]CAA6657226.1 unnamed protein product [Spirodela intermedia]